MSIIKIKEKSPTSKGNSQFIRQKLQEQYNPKVRFFKQQLMSFSIIDDENKYENKAKEEWHVCQNAIQKLKEGKQIILDWNTKSNFRATRNNYKSANLNPELPKIKTEPSQLNYAREAANNRRLAKSKPKVKAIFDKKLQLQKLLFTHNKKNYLRSKKQKQDYHRLFGDNLDYHSSKLNSCSRVRSKVVSHVISASNSHCNIQEIQEFIMNRSKLNILKQDLKNKFNEIKLMCNSSKIIKEWSQDTQKEERIGGRGRC